MSRFFIDRPVFAWVIAIVIMLAGALSIFEMPVEQYPRIAPPSVNIRATYPGASAETLENSVTQVIEQNMTGIDYLRYFSSKSDSAGNVNITLTFEPEADPNIAQVQVQNKLQGAMSLLPEEVQRQGVTVTKANDTFLLVIGLVSKDQTKYNEAYLGDYLSSKLQDPISRVNGVGNVTVFGQPHAMRIWVNPNKLFSYNLTLNEIEAAIRAQNADVSAGELGGLPATDGQQINATITAQSRLRSVEDFEQIVVKSNTDGSFVYLKDVARIEIGSQSYATSARYNQNAAAGMAVSLATGANALETADAVRSRIADLTANLPEEVSVIYPYDTTPFVRISINEVVKTLVEAIVLVFCVMYLFLQNFRATLIPTIAVPVVLLGTFATLAAFGFTINTLTMFAMVLAIGLLVDDAIVVVENVERVMSEEGLSPKEATRKSMDQITSALIGIALVLSAVFVPMAFFQGSTGAIYRQFSLTIVSAMLLSVVVALVLTPALCASLLKPAHKGEFGTHKGFFGKFNTLFDKSKTGYGNSSRGIIARPWRFVAIYAAMLAVLALMFVRIPTSFLPDEDQGIMFVQITTPTTSTSERTLEAVKKVEEHFLTNEKENIQGIFTVVGFNFSGRGQNSAIGFVRMKDWEERPEESQSVFAIAGRAMGALSQVKDAMIFAFTPPAVTELGRSAGFDLQLVDRGGVGHEKLTEARNQLLGMASQNPAVTAVRPNGLEDAPQFKVDVDIEKASALGLSLSDINNTLQTAWGSRYVNDFLEDGRIKRVYMQADAPFRMNPDDINLWFVRNNAGEMVPFSAFTSARWEYGSPQLERYNGLSSMNIKGQPAPGQSSGAAMAAMEEMAEKLPQGVDYEWTGLSYEERSAGAQAPALYALSVLVVFLCLAALYESWAVPFAVMLVVPIGVLGAVIAANFTGLSNDIYFQVGLLTTIGLTAKNAILIVEFAKEMHEKGRNVVQSAITAAEQRLRPILMTSFAFILGVTPLATANGAGSGSQNAIGIGVMGGMIAATVLAIFFVPLFFVLIEKYFVIKNKPHHKTPPVEGA